jgi:cytosine deaminase
LVVILKNLRLWGWGEPVDIIVDEGKIAFVGQVQEEGEDFGGRAVFPGFVEVHCHLDKTLSPGVDGLENQSGTLLEAIERWRASKTKRTKEDYKARAAQPPRHGHAQGPRGAGSDARAAS